MDDQNYNTVFRQTPNGPEVITLCQVIEEQNAGKSRNAIKAGGFVCCLGHPMTYASGAVIRPYFRHDTSKSRKTVSTTQSMQTHVGCGMSPQHLDAQIYLRDNDYQKRTLHFSQWRKCGLHTDTAYTAKGNVHASLEVRMENGRFVSDVAFWPDKQTYQADDQKTHVQMHLEVEASHKADGERRQNIVYLELKADHIIDKFVEANSKSLDEIYLRCEGRSEKRCFDCEEAKRRREEAKEADRQAKARELERHRLYEVERTRREAEREAERVRQEAEREAERVRQEVTAKILEELMETTLVEMATEMATSEKAAVEEEAVATRLLEDVLTTLSVEVANSANAAMVIEVAKEARVEVARKQGSKMALEVVKTRAKVADEPLEVRAASRRESEPARRDSICARIKGRLSDTNADLKEFLEEALLVARKEPGTVTNKIRRCRKEEKARQMFNGLDDRVACEDIWRLTRCTLWDEELAKSSVDKIKLMKKIREWDLDYEPLTPAESKRKRASNDEATRPPTK